MPAGDDFMVQVTVRFLDDVDAIVEDVVASAQQAWLMGDTTITSELIDMDADAVDLRLAQAVDSATWQGYQAGRVDVIAGPDGEGLFWWDLDPGAQHCADCLARAAGGPYTLTQLVTEIGMPGDAPTECDGGCRCSLRAAA